MSSKRNLFKIAKADSNYASATYLCNFLFSSVFPPKRRGHWLVPCGKKQLSLVFVFAFQWLEVARATRNSLIEKIKEKPSKTLSVRCCICKLAHKHPEMGPWRPLPTGAAGEDFCQKRMRDVLRDICWMQSVWSEGVGCVLRTENSTEGYY